MAGSLTSCRCALSHQPASQPASLRFLPVGGRQAGKAAQQQEASHLFDTPPGLIYSFKDVPCSMDFRKAPARLDDLAMPAPPPPPRPRQEPMSAGPPRSPGARTTEAPPPPGSRPRYARPTQPSSGHLTSTWDPDRDRDRDRNGGGGGGGGSGRGSRPQQQRLPQPPRPARARGREDGAGVGAVRESAREKLRHTRPRRVRKEASHWSKRDSDSVISLASGVLIG